MQYNIIPFISSNWMLISRPVHVVLGWTLMKWMDIDDSQDGAVYIDEKINWWRCLGVYCSLYK